MLAWGTPETLLDATRLSDFSAEPKKSHGASSAHRIPLCLRLHGPLSRPVIVPKAAIREERMTACFVERLGEPPSFDRV